MKLFKITSLFLLIAIVFSSCNFNNAIFSDYKDWIPQDFDSKNTVLLVQNARFDPSKNQAMENYLEKNYPGKYIVTTIEKIEDKGGEFADTKIYRYAFVWGGTTKLSVPSTRPSDVDGHFYDREKEILYPSTRKTNNYGSKVYQPFINSIVRHIETSAK